MKRYLKIAGLILVVLLVAIQLVPVDRSNPPVVADIEAPGEVEAVLRTACYDCHSHETSWPWYSYVAPVSWLVAHDVEEARSEMSFSEWGRLDPREQRELREEMWEEVSEGNMPLKKYRLIHPEARLTDEQKQILHDWCRAPESARSE